jgi:hypothetical protein
MSSICLFVFQYFIETNAKATNDKTNKPAKMPTAIESYFSLALFSELSTEVSLFSSLVFIVRGETFTHPGQKEPNILLR